MATTVTAIYEGGVLRLKEPIALREGTQVQVVIIGDVPDPADKSPAELLAEIAALPMEGKPGRFSSRDHDEILYGEPHTS